MRERHVCTERHVNTGRGRKRRKGDKTKRENIYGRREVQCGKRIYRDLSSIYRQKEINTAREKGNEEGREDWERQSESQGISVQERHIYRHRDRRKKTDMKGEKMRRHSTRIGRHKEKKCINTPRDRYNYIKRKGN